ncbi:unnamed protein product [Protopolystoma xenopodis]|uniref:Uncharacterized protein n=1 Tax=Protopolystoma xenopodis TaxID=117903 RepID=A0A3S5CQJ1_9PLAT|nr:unnamed protein product [Protopolystoma xenopodis]
MAILTDDADYDAGETIWNVPRQRFNFGNDHADNGPRTRTNDSSAQIHRGHKTVSPGLLRTIQQTKVQGNTPAISGEGNLRIPLTNLLKRSESYAAFVVINVSMPEDTFHITDLLVVSRLYLYEK